MKRKFLLSLSLLFLGSCQLPTSPTSSLVSSSTTSSSETFPSSISSSTRREVLELDGIEDFQSFDRYERFSLDGLTIYHTVYQDEEVIEKKEVTSLCHLILDRDETEILSGSVLDEVGTFNVHFTYEGVRSSSFLLLVRSVYAYEAKLSTSLEEGTISFGSTIEKDEISVKQEISYLDETGTKREREEDVYDFTLLVDGEERSTYTFQEEGKHTIEIKAKGNDGETLSWIRNVGLRTDTGAPIEYEDDTIPAYTDSSTMKVHVTNPSRDSNVDPLGIDKTNKGYYTPEEVELAYTIYDYGEKNVYNWKYAPAMRKDGIQKTPVLVVPVLVPGASLSRAEEETVKENIETAFFGKSADMNYESLRSYFLQSSFGQLEITGRVTDVFDARADSSFYHSLYDLDNYNFPDLAQECADFATDLGIDLSAYDSDKDGLIDAMWLVWVGCGYNSNTVYWPFSTSTQADVDPTRDFPIVNNIGWCGETFLTDFSEDNPIDAHVVIHETSHMLGLSDYYSYTGYGYAPLGDVDMMNQNVGDHNPYSKMLLGWKTPYLVYGNDVEITLESSVTSGDFIVLLDDEYQFKATKDGTKALFNPFDEYLVLDYYSNQGKLSGQYYDAYAAEPIDGKGGRLHHVDNRLFSVDASYRTTLLEDSTTAFTNAVKWPYKAIDNSSETYDTNFALDRKYGAMDEIRLIDRNKRYLSSYSLPDQNTLFYAGDSFSLPSYRGQFLNGKMDSEKSFSTTFEVTKIG